MIQQGVSLDPSGSSHDSEGGGMTIGRVMDWTEARLEAIRSREEEEDEDEEREKDKDRTRPPAGTRSASHKPDDKVPPSGPSMPERVTKVDVSCCSCVILRNVFTVSIHPSLYHFLPRIHRQTERVPSSLSNLRHLLHLL